MEPRSLRLALAALVWSVGLIVAALIVPAYSGHTVTSGDGLTISKATLVVENGAWVLIPVAVPAIVSLVVAIALRRRALNGSVAAGLIAWAAIVLLGAFTLLLILSIGGFIVPVVVLLGMAAKRTPLGGPERRAKPPTKRVATA